MIHYKNERQKIKYIQDFIPHYKAIKPYIDKVQVECVKQALYDAGYYKGYYSIDNEAIIHLILKAQGKSKYQATFGKGIK